MKIPEGDIWPLFQTDDWPLIRIVVPAFAAANIYSRQAVKTTPLGPIMVATAANKLRWRVEVIDENNFRTGPRDANGLPDHAAIQAERFASVVGFYCGLTSTMDRVYELAAFYRAQGSVCIAGSWHAHYCPEEVLRNGIHLVAHGDGDIVIQDILGVLERGEDATSIPGTSCLVDGELKSNVACSTRETGPDRMRLEVENLNHLPYPDFGLLRYAGTIKTYPITRIHGCAGMCEFCSVRGKPRWASAQHLFNTVQWLVDTRGAKNFFIVDDRLEEDARGTMEFFKLIAAKYGNSLEFAVQMRLGAAKKPKLLQVMKDAGVGAAFIGYESPIDEDLKAMKKGYLSKHMIEWTHIIRKYFWVHGMFIFGYPGENSTGMGVAEMISRFKDFIWKSGILSIQVLHPVPIVGTVLRDRLAREGKLFPYEIVPRSKYDGNFACFRPEGMTLQEFQDAPIDIMKWFYRRRGWRLPLRVLDLFYKGALRDLGGWRGVKIRFGARLIIKEWNAAQDSDQFVRELENYDGPMQAPEQTGDSDTGCFQLLV